MGVSCFSLFFPSFLWPKKVRQVIGSVTALMPLISIRQLVGWLDGQSIGWLDGHYFLKGWEAGIIFPNWITCSIQTKYIQGVQCSLIIVFFLTFFYFSAAALVFCLPGVCTHTDTEGKQRKARVRNIF